MVEVAIARAESFAGSSGSFSPKVIEEIVEAAVKMFDPQNGGFGSAPKFPHPAVLDRHGPIPGQMLGQMLMNGSAS